MKHSTYVETDVKRRCGNCEYCGYGVIASQDHIYTCEHPDILKKKPYSCWLHSVNPAFGICDLFKEINK